MPGEDSEAAFDSEGSLSCIEKKVWSELVESSYSAKGIYHTGSLSTFGEFPESRTVVLRFVDPERRELRSHTDLRSEKVRQIQANPRVTYHFYSPEAKIQVRLRAFAEVNWGNAVSEAGWENSSLSSRRCYLCANAPGYELEEPGSGLPEHLLNRVPTAEESESGYANFAVILCRVTHMTWLHLAATGHRCATFDYQSGSVRAAWVNP